MQVSGFCARLKLPPQLAFPNALVWWDRDPQEGCPEAASLASSGEDPTSPPHHSSMVKRQILHYQSRFSLLFWNIPRRSLPNIQLMAGNINMHENIPLKREFIECFWRGLTEPTNTPSHPPAWGNSLVLSSHYLFLLHWSSYPWVALLNVFN